jgi:hypothetical protein
MNTEKVIPISYVKKFTKLAVGDVLVNINNDSELTLNVNNIHEANLSWPDRNYSVVSFADRPNTTGAQPIKSSVAVDISFHGAVHFNRRPSEWLWFTGAGISSWKPNHAAMLKQYQSEQGANTMFTYENTKEATGWAIAGENQPCFYKVDNVDDYHVLYGDLDHWNGACGTPYFDFIELSRPTGESKEDHADADGNVNYALTYKLDLFTEYATHYSHKGDTFYRTMDGKFAMVLNDWVWVVSDCTTNSELDGIEFWKLDAEHYSGVIDAVKEVEARENQNHDWWHDSFANCHDEANEIQSAIKYADNINDLSSGFEKVVEPAFTQEADCECYFAGKWVEGITIGKFGCCTVIAPSGGGFYGFDDDDIRPIDNRTETEKLRDAIRCELDKSDSSEHDIDVLLASEKLTIKLKG